MKLLEERIRKDGVVKPGEILKVDSFLNHQMDVDLFNPGSESPASPRSIFMCPWSLPRKRKA